LQAGKRELLYYPFHDEEGIQGSGNYNSQP
jgi:hypothetical protein